MKKVGIIVLAFICIIFGGICAFFVYETKAYPISHKEIIVKECESQHISPPLVASLINAESGFNEKAISKAGAVGLMQLMPSTAKWMAKKIEIENYNDDVLFNGATNIKIGVAYLAYLFKKFSTLETVLAAYNAGEGQVKVWLLSSNYSNDKTTLKSTPFGETNNYISKVKYGISKYEKKFS